MPSGFALLDDAFMGPIGGGNPLWSIKDVRFGHATNWALQLCLERQDVRAECMFDRVDSFRVHDESEIATYWIARQREQVSVGTLYTIADSAYRTELQAAGVSGWTSEMTHYLLAGQDVCVEILTTARPTMRKIGLPDC